jgi:hypothetical protein
MPAMAGPALPSTQNAIGFFAPASPLEAPNPLLADFIDLDSRDYVDIFTGDDPIDASVKVALGTVRGSGPSVTDVGLPPEPRKMDAAHLMVLKANVQLALRDLIRRGDITLIGVTTDFSEESQQFTQIRVQWRNLRALDAKVRTLPLPVPLQGAAA